MPVGYTQSHTPNGDSATATHSCFHCPGRSPSRVNNNHVSSNHNRYPVIVVLALIPPPPKIVYGIVWKECLRGIYEKGMRRQAYTLIVTLTP